MKVKVLSRNPDNYLRQTKRDIHKIPRNYDPSLHPFEAPREYIRALNATKLERVFAKPFVGSLEGHKDSVQCMAKHPSSLSKLLSGACDGQVKLWNLANQHCVSTVQAHDGFVQGLCVVPDGNSFLTCGTDQTIKLWSMSEEGVIKPEPESTILGKDVYQQMDHSYGQDYFATCGQQVDLWNLERAEPIKTFTWGTDGIYALKFNQVETNLLACCASDRSVMLYDMRGTTPLRKVIMKLKSNAVAWNPMEAFIFTVANEDYNLYTFDMRKLERPLKMHKDHVSAVLDVDYSPTGKEFVSGSFDKSVRIFPVDSMNSREVYHTKRMQRVTTVKWSLDDKYIISGSMEMNVRVWKAHASEKLGILKPREKDTFRYNEKLKEKFASHPQIRRIAKHRHVPKMIYNSRKEIQAMEQSEKRKERNRRRHSKPSESPAAPLMSAASRVVSLKE